MPRRPRARGLDRQPGLAFSEEALGAIERHAWPGNVRELLNAIKRASIVAEGSHVTALDIGLPALGTASEPVDDTLTLRAVRQDAERRGVVGAIARTNGNLLKAAESLGTSRPTLYDLMRRLAIQHAVGVD